MKIALFDDQEYGLEQIRKSLPADLAVDIDYYSRLAEWQASAEQYDVVLLDYFLDKDGLLGTDVIDQVRPRAKVIIAYSSLQKGNTHLMSAGADYIALKGKGQSSELENIFLEII